MNLHKLAWKFGCDKGPRRLLEGAEAVAVFGQDATGAVPHGHGYTLAYEREFERFGVKEPHPLGRVERIQYTEDGAGRITINKPALLEIGVQSGASMALWDAYFPANWKVVGADIEVPAEVRERLEKTLTKRVHILKGDSTRLGFAKDVQHDHGQFEIVIDDGSHYPAHQVATLQNFWPLVKPGGIYCLEDLHQSWWPAALKQNTIVPVLVELLEDCIGRGKFAEWSGVPAADPVVRPEEEVLFSVRAYRNMVVFEKRVKP